MPRNPLYIQVSIHTALVFHGGTVIVTEAMGPKVSAVTPECHSPFSASILQTLKRHGVRES